MKYVRLITVTGILASLLACGSNPAKDRYYSLVLASEPALASESESDIRMIVGPVQLARYLDQPGLPIQTGASQIQSANHHFWAEPLDEAIAKVLVQDIAQQIDAVQVERDAGQWTPAAHCRVRIEFDKFHATSDSKVVTTGRYWLHRANSSVVTKKEFNIVKTLSDDGYANAVRQLRTSLGTLALDIVERTEAEAACAPTG